MCVKKKKANREMSYSLLVMHICSRKTFKYRAHAKPCA